MEDKSKRKSTRGFNLEKPKKRTFNLEKETECPVEPKVKGKDNSAGGKQKITPTAEAANGTSEGGKRWIVLSVVLVLIVVAVVALRGCGKDKATQPATAPIENVADSTQKEKPDSSSSQEQTQATGSTEQAEAPTSEQNANANNASTVSSTSSPAGKTVEEMANQVWDGVYGNGTERKAKLGSDYAKVQKRVNEMYRNGYRH